MVELVQVTRENWREGLEIRAATHQQRFVADHEPVALLILAKAFVRVGDQDWWPLFVQAHGQTVGVAALVEDRDRYQALALFHLLIDHRQQRRGYGGAALRELILLASTTDNCHQLRLTVHPENHAAIALYRSERFHQDGSTADGELSMSLSVIHGPLGTPTSGGAA